MASVHCYGCFFGSRYAIHFYRVAALEYANVNLAVAVLIWIMIYPMMINVDFASLADIKRKPKGLCVTLVVELADSNPLRWQR